MSGMMSTLLIVGVIILGGWCFIAGPCKGMFAGGVPGLFGGTLTGQGIAQGYGQILTQPGQPTKVINPSNAVVGVKAPVTGSASINRGAGNKSVPRLNASGSVRAGAGASYTSLVNTGRVAI